MYNFDNTESLIMKFSK